VKLWRGVIKGVSEIAQIRSESRISKGFGVDPFFSAGNLVGDSRSDVLYSTLHVSGAALSLSLSLSLSLPSLSAFSIFYFHM